MGHTPVVDPVYLDGVSVPAWSGLDTRPLHLRQSGKGYWRRTGRGWNRGDEAGLQEAGVKVPSAPIYGYAVRLFPAGRIFILGFSLLSMSEFFVFRKMETCETKNHPLCGCESRSYTKSPFRFIIEVSKPLSKKGKVIYMAKKANDLAHTKWMCKYHIVFTPKYRRKVIYNQYKEDLRDILKQLCSYKGVEILEGKLMPDHVHMLVAIPPKYSVSSFMGYLKGKSALMMFDRHANLKYKFGNRHFWSEGYYVSTVGLNEDTIRKYIKEQERYDQMVDKLSVKEYEDPFKG